MNILFIMDPLGPIHPRKDTTFLLIREAKRRKMEAFFCRHTDLTSRPDGIGANVSRIARLEVKAPEANGSGEEQTDYLLEPRESRSLSDFAAVFLRTDPPFDSRYLTATYLLELAVSQTLIINHPVAVRDWNEKLSILKFKGLSPESLVATDLEVIRAFVKESGGRAVVKDLFRSGGEGVFLLDLADPNFRSLVDVATDQGRRWALVQRFVTEGKQGDKRVILIDGEPLGAVLRVSQTADFRNNLHLGGASVKTELTAREREICAALKPELQKKGLFLVGLDFLGDYLTEINVTSPTCFQEINRLNGLTGDQTLEAQTFDQLLKKLPKATR